MTLKFKIAELDMQYMSIQMLNEYRTGWKKEVDSILEKYMECRDESILKQKEQGLLEVNFRLCYWLHPWLDLWLDFWLDF